MPYSKHDEACVALTGLKIWSHASLPGLSGLPGWSMNDLFRKNLRIALNGGGPKWAVRAMMDKDKHAVDEKFLDAYSLKRWEGILHFMVGSQVNFDGISTETRQALLHAGLIRFEANDSMPCITADGFQFLLMDTKSQIWLFVLKMLELIDSKTSNLVECLTFLMQLNFSTLGRDYSAEGLTDTILSFLQQLREIGLMYQRKRKDGRFYPTRLVIDLASGLRDVKIDIHRKGFIVVESNYRLYAYTDSPLQIALIALFCEVHYRFPNIIIGLITRDSVRQALKSGISAKQIINYLLMHVHPIVKDNEHAIPPTVLDQINLWEKERDKFLFKEGVLYSQFNSQSDFELLRKYANELGCLIFDNPSKRVMVVSNEGHDEVRRFWKKHKKDH